MILALKVAGWKVRLPLFSPLRHSKLIYMSIGNFIFHSKKSSEPLLLLHRMDYSTASTRFLELVDVPRPEIIFQLKIYNMLPKRDQQRRWSLLPVRNLPIET
jgi:hypothetical protein